MWTSRKVAYFACFVGLLLQANMVLAEPFQAWGQLTAAQQEALRPLAAQWDTLPAPLQKNLLHASGRYLKLTPEHKRRFRDRLEKWSKLTPEQRTHAREKFQAFSKVPPEKREQVKQMVREQEARKSDANSASTVPSPP